MADTLAAWVARLDAVFPSTAWREIGSPVGPLSVLLPPVESDAFEPVVGDVPSLGNANEALRSLRDGQLQGAAVLRPS